jgi:glutamyl-tRNA synthetase
MEDDVVLDGHQRELIASICDAFSQATSFLRDDVERLLREVLAGQGAKLKDVAHAIRVTVTGRAVGPGLFDMLSVIGREITIIRLRKLIGG